MVAELIVEYIVESAQIEMKKFSHTFTYEGTDVLFYEIQYPEVSMPQNRAAAARINSVILSQVNAYNREAQGSLYNEAVKGYFYSQNNGFPFNPYGFAVKYEVALNDNCALSLYRDAYRYLGGAHGNTLRSSDTFDLDNGGIIRLQDLFPKDEKWRFKILAAILKQAEEIMANDPYFYFENYRQLILENFDRDNFYLTPSGIAVYYQQYEIGPYAVGIQVFEIPYGDVGASPPSCR